MTDRRLAGIALTVTVAVLLGYGSWALVADQEPVLQAPAPGFDPSDPGETVISRAEVAQHRTRDDCWTVIDDEVYDLTSFIGSHPGGIAILEACGRDGTTLFEDRRTPEGLIVGSGESHSSGAEDRLEELQIGELDD